MAATDFVTEAQLTALTEAIGADTAAIDGRARAGAAVTPPLARLGHKLQTGQTAVLGIASDSTADMAPPAASTSTREWPGLFADRVAALFPQARVLLRNWQDGPQAYAEPTIIAAGTPRTTGGTLIDDGFGRTTGYLRGTTADTVAYTWDGAGSPSADGSTATIPRHGALSVVAPSQSVTVTADLKVTTAVTEVNQYRFGAAMTNAGLNGYGVVAQLQVNSGGAAFFMGLQARNSAGESVEIVPLAQKALGLATNSATAQDLRAVLDVNGSTVTYTITVGSTVTTITGEIPAGGLDWMGYYAGAANWVGASAFKVDRLAIGTAATPNNYAVLDIWNGSHPGAQIDYQGSRAAVMYPQPLDALIVSSGHNSLARNPASYLALMDTNIGLMRAQRPEAAVVIASQNPKEQPGQSPVLIELHARRMATLRGYAAEHGYEYLPTFEDFSMTGGTLTADGTHPNQAGSQVWADTLTRAVLGRT